VALENLIYGVSCTRVLDGKTIECTITLSENHNTILWLIEKKEQNIIKIDINQISQISFDPANKEFSKMNFKNILLQSNYISIFDQTESFHLIFGLSIDLEILLASISFIFKFEGNTEDDPSIRNIKRIWMNYDTDFSGKLELNEFIRFRSQYKIRQI
jgi:hypothetical protein